MHLHGSVHQETIYLYIILLQAYEVNNITLQAYNNIHNFQVYMVVEPLCL